MKSVLSLFQLQIGQKVKRADLKVGDIFSYHSTGLIKNLLCLVENNIQYGIDLNGGNVGFQEINPQNIPIYYFGFKEPTKNQLDAVYLKMEILKKNEIDPRAF